MIVRTSLRSLARRRSRTLLALIGIAISVALLLDMTMLASGLTRSFGELMRAQGYGLRVTPRGTLPFDSEAGIREAAALRGRIEAVEGVAGVAPILGAQLYAVRDDEARQPLFTTGIDPDAQMLYLLLEGTDPAPGEMVISRPLAEAYRLGLGDSLDLAAELDVALGRARSLHPYRVSGIADFLFDYSGGQSVALRLEEVQALTDRPDEVSLLAVAASPGADEQAVARRIEAVVGDVSVYSTVDLMSAMDRRLAYFRQLSTVLGTIALAVAALLVGTIVTIGVRERFGEIATLRAIGVPAHRLLAGIIAEGVTLTTLGCALGIPLGLWMAGRLDRILLAFPGIPARVSFFVVDPLPLGAALLATIAVGALVGLAPGLSALRAPLAQALREEAD